MPIPRNFDYIAHNARVQSQRSQMRDDDTLHRRGEVVDTSRPLAETAPPTRRDERAISTAAGNAPPSAGLPRSTSAASLVLPWPPTGNHAVKHTTTGAHYLRPEVAQYRRHVAALAHRLPKITGRYHLHVHLSPPDARARDMDNALKSINDALVRCGFLIDDSMTYMRELHVTTDDARQGSAIVRAEVIEGPREAA